MSKKYEIKDGILNVSNKGIKSFSEIFQDFTNEELNSIIALNCSFNQIKSFEDLSFLPNLKELYCSYNQIKSCEGLSSLPNLEKLNCSYNSIISFEGLNSTNLSKLKILYYYNNPLHFIYQNKKLEEILYINALLQKCQDNTKILIVKKFLKDKIKEKKLNSI
jgi:Leucine-rich repeat (LRR) protein